ncbi:MAG: hypothetical protein KatS3mg057_0675 [Herpetosiphonaceae bacterium]|nr:MAG: hypothetical protein KatS3mg057_0675 [Herpetosiphonaceae bacterium]
MAEQHVTTGVELLAEIERAWDVFHATLDRLTETQMTTIKDAQGWTVKDHLIHLTAWERSVISFLQGEARHIGLGIDESVYLTGNEDAINAAVYQQQRNISLQAVLDRLRATHQQLIVLVQRLTDTDLQQPYRHYLPDEPGDGDGPPAINLIYGNAVHHFYEHLAWIEGLVTSASSAEQ